MLDGSINIIAEPEENPLDEIVHTGARKGGEVPGRLSYGVGSGDKYLMPHFE